MTKLIKTLTERFMNAASSIRQHSLLIPTLVSFLSFMGAVLLILSIWFTRNVASTLEETLHVNATQSSIKAASQLQSTFQDIANMAAHLEKMDSISPRSYRDNIYDAFKAVLPFSSFKYTNLVFCYENMPLLLTVYGTCYAPVCFPEVDDPDFLLETIHDASSISLYSTAQFGASWEESRLLMLYPLSSQHTAVFVINNSRLSTIVSPGAGDDDSLQVLFASNGSVLWSNRPLDDHVQELLRSSIHDASISGKLTLDGAEYLYSSNIVAHGSRLISLEKITSQFDSLNTMLNMLALICAFILILGTLFLIYSIHCSYMPIASLVRELRGVLPEAQDESSTDISTLRRAYSQYSILLQESQKNATLFSDDQLRSLFVLRTISGRYSDAEELHNLCLRLNIHFPYQYLFACLLLFDHVHSDQERKDAEAYLSYKDQDSLVSSFYLLPDGRSAVGIVNVPSSDPAILCSFGEHLLSQLPSALGATLGIGQIYEDITSLGKSYLEAHAALDYRLIKGKNTWITYSEVSSSSTVPAYPHQLINSYINTVRTWDVQGIREKLQQITTYIHNNNLPLQEVKCICFDLTSAFLREINSLDKHVTYKSSTAYDVFSIAEYDSVSELAQKIANFSENIQQYIAKHNECQNSDLIRRCMEYMRSNISNAQFSLSSCSEQFDIAQQTLRRKFKEATGWTLSSYMTSLRIDRAKELLISTELDINTICEQCGYLDLSSFIRLFKSETGVSPGKFREMHPEGMDSQT